MKLFFNKAGLIDFSTKTWDLHFFIKPKYWIWFHKTEEYECCLDYYGLGPLFLLVIPNWRCE